jgi:hypothetical protein
LTFAEKFDDIKFGKVLTKLYARLFSMEQVKFLPPKFSHSMKDLTNYLGIFEITEEDLKRSKDDISETSSNLSQVTQGMFRPTGQQLEVVHEGESNDASSDSQEEDEVMPSAVGQIIKSSAQNYV